MSRIRLEIAGLVWASSDADTDDDRDAPALEVRDTKAPATPGEVWLANGIMPSEQMEEAGRMLGHLNEAMFGFVSGDSGRPLPGEPRPEYDPALGKTKRIRAKAKELQKEERTLWRLWRNYQEVGLSALIDRRRLRAKSGVNLETAVELALLEEAEKQGGRSDLTKDAFRRRVFKNVEKRLGKGEVEIPSRQTMNRAFNQFLSRKGTFTLSAQSQRTKLARPKDEFGTLEADRPGEYVVIDSTRLDVMTIDPVTYEPVPVELTVALDVYSRKVLAFNLLPLGVLGADLAYMLAEIVSPSTNDPKWPDGVERPYAGIPDHIVLRAFDLPDGTVLNPKSLVKPGTVIVDHGRNYQSAVFTDGCRMMGINIQSARLHRGSDKSHVERYFGTIRTRLLQYLPGYKGNRVEHRGPRIEDEATLLMSDLERAIGEWIVRDYHQRPHPGLAVKDEPTFLLTPDQAFREGIERSGLLYVPDDPHMRQRLLPTDLRTVTDEGLKFKNLIYDSKELPKRVREEDSPWGKRWPISYDPHDLRSIWFNDNVTGKWIELRWKHAPSVPKPFGENAVRFVKTELIQRGVKRPTEVQIERRLYEVLDDIEDHIVKPAIEAKKVRIRSANAEAKAKQRRVTPITNEPHPSPNLDELPDIDWPLDAPELGVRK